MRAEKERLIKADTFWESYDPNDKPLYYSEKLVFWEKNFKDGYSKTCIYFALVDTLINMLITHIISGKMKI